MAMASDHHDRSRLFHARSRIVLRLCAAFCCWLLILSSAACSNMRIVRPEQDGFHTDFEVGRIYTLSKPVFLKVFRENALGVDYWSNLPDLRDGGSVEAQIQEYRSKPGIDGRVGLLDAGTRIQFVFFMNWDFFTGNPTFAIGRILDGKFAGKQVIMPSTNDVSPLRVWRNRKYLSSETVEWNSEAQSRP